MLECNQYKHPDVFLLRYVAFPVLLVLAVELLVEYGYFGLGALGLIAVLAWAVIAVVRLVANAIKRRWWTAASILAAPLVIGLTGWGAHVSGLSPDRLRFLLWQADYLGEIAAQPGHVTSMQIRIWPWRDFAAGLILAPQEVDLLVYDSGDQVALPIGSRTKEWLARADKAGDFSAILVHPEENTIVNRVGEHFYIISTEF